MQVTGTCGTLTATMTFQFTIASACSTATLTASTVTTPTSYTINTATANVVNIDVPLFTASTASCGITYTLVDTSGTLDGAFTFDTSGANPKVVVSTIDINKAGTSKTLNVVGTITGYTGTATTNNFVVNFIDPCTGVTVTTSALSTYTFDISSTAP